MTTYCRDARGGDARDVRGGAVGVAASIIGGMAASTTGEIAAGIDISDGDIIVVTRWRRATINVIAKS